MLNFFTKPVTAISEIAEEESSIVSIVKGIICSVLLALFSLITAIANTVIIRESTIRIFALNTIDEVDFDLLEDFPFFSTFFKQLGINLLIIFGLAIIMFAIAKLFKKEKTINFFLSFTSNAFIIFTIITLVGTLLGISYGPFKYYLNIAAYIITALIILFIFKNLFDSTEVNKIVLIITIIGTILFMVIDFIERYQVKKEIDELWEETEKKISKDANEFVNYIDGFYFDDPEDFID